MLDDVARLRLLPKFLVVSEKKLSLILCSLQKLLFIVLWWKTSLRIFLLNQMIDLDCAAMVAQRALRRIALLTKLDKRHRPSEAIEVIFLIGLLLLFLQFIFYALLLWKNLFKSSLRLVSLLVCGGENFWLEGVLDEVVLLLVIVVVGMDQLLR